MSSSLRSKISILLALIVVLSMSLALFGTNRLSTYAASASISLSLTYGSPTSAVNVKGSGFIRSENVLLTFDTTQIKSVTDSRTGSFSTNVTIPGSAQPGNHIIQAKGKSSGYTAQAIFLVQTDWVQQGFNREHTGFNVFENVLNTGNVSQLTQSWSFNSDFGDGAIAVAHGVIYFGCNLYYVCALSTATGQLLWNYNTNEQVTATPAVANNLVYMNTTGGHVDALNATSGKLVWSYTTGFTITDAPLTANGLVYVGASNGVLYVLNGTTGQAMWKHTFQSVFSTPSIDGSLLYVSAGGNLYALKSPTGQIVWHVSAKGGTPVIANGMIYLNDTADGKLLALNEQTGALKWSVANPNGYLFGGDPSVANGVVYITEPSLCNLEALSAATGALLWQYNSLGIPTCIDRTAVVANGVVFVGSSDEYDPDCACSAVYEFSATTGVLAGYIEDDVYVDYPSGNDPIVVVNGIVYYSATNSVYTYHLPS